MKFKLFSSLLVLLLAMTSCSPDPELAETKQEQPDLQDRRALKERVVVANRASGDISVVNAKTDALIATYPMPDNGEPMYVVHVRSAHKVFVGDRANNRVVAFNERNFNVEGIIPTGNGVFHMWASPQGNQLWVNNDIDNTTTVINPNSMQVIATVQTPADLVAMGGKPHDVVVTRNAAFVTVLGVAGTNDYVVKYSASQFCEVARAAVGQDPHVSFTRNNRLLYVPCQNSNTVFVLQRSNLNQVTTIPFDGAHGAGMSNGGEFFYTADISGNRLGAISTSSNSLIGTLPSTPFSTPHNLAINRNDCKLYVTHSGGTADKLSIYHLTPLPVLESSLTIGTNPFGLTYYKFR